MQHDMRTLVMDSCVWPDVTTYLGMDRKENTAHDGVELGTCGDESERRQAQLGASIGAV